MLTLALLVLLSALVIGSFHGTLQATRVEESSSRMASLLRTARAEAANAGRRFRLGFDAETGQPVVSIEPDPLGAPGAFQPYLAWWVKLGRLEAGVRALSCELTGASAFADLETSQPGEPQQDKPTLAEITFYPDGTSDSARIVLANDDEDHPWAVQITLNGVDGTIDTQEINMEEESTQ
ncbi:MAG: hypothetical protein AMJ81_11100 [Phycisphaerae bacterium SM23_33]|nr:MAG: hypothetical protein AMJ81_11100 [Phycisphaerae bacterium SM23_33]